jgi:hypothetical protein
MIEYTTPTTRDLIDSLLFDIFTGRLQPEDTKADRLYFYDLNLSITNPINDLDLQLVQWQRKRWRKFGREYMSTQSIWDWIDRCTIKEKGASDWAEIGYEFSKAKGSRGHNVLGNCISGMSFHRRPYPRVTVTSRVTNFLPVAFLEMSLANLVCQEISQRLDQPVQWQWYITQMQFSIQWSFPYWYHIFLPEYGRQVKKNGYNSFTPHIQLWTERLHRRYQDMATGKVESYPYKRETNLYLRTQKEFPSYLPELEHLYD